MLKKRIVILGGGTFAYVRNHLAIAAPAFGTTARQLHQLLPNSQLVLTRMAAADSKIETNQDVSNLIAQLLLDDEVGGIVMNVAMCDYDGQIGELKSGEYAERLKSRGGQQLMKLTPSQKVISTIKKQRSDIILVGFKTTTNHSPKEQIQKAERMILESDCDFVLANDVVTRNNMLITRGTCIISTKDRKKTIEQLAERLERKVV
ncbi:MAG: hypothetical protein GY810_23335 [Aureispira sp.]|nr:hypothetical protein [Aureispira sp.]